MLADSKFCFLSDDEEMDQFELCLQITIKAHEGQTRRGSEEPYSDHPIRVAKSLDDIYSQCVALLHDVLEDTDETHDTLREKGVDEDVI